MFFGKVVYPHKIRLSIYLFYLFVLTRTGPILLLCLGPSQSKQLRSYLVPKKNDKKLSQDLKVCRVVQDLSAELIQVCSDFASNSPVPM